MGSITSSSHQHLDLDLLIIGAGFGGCYALHKFRKQGLKTHVFEAGTAIGGVWHWNRYPGARVDSEIPYYQFTVPEVWRTWNWSQRFPGHEELREYFAHVDKVLDLSKDISLSADVVSATFDEEATKWKVTCGDGRTATSTYLVCATGSSFKRHYPDFTNIKTYETQLHHAAFWPKDLVTKGKRVAIIGTAQQESNRTVALSLPMGQRQLTTEEQDINKSIYKTLFNHCRQTTTTLGYDQPEGEFSDLSVEEREKLFEELWNRGGFNFTQCNYRDFLVDKDANNIVYDFWARKIRQRIKNPEKRDILAPLEPPFAFGTKRSSLEQDYFECLDQDNVEIVDLKKNPIKEFTKTGIVTEDGKESEFDVVILATGYDSMTGSLTNMGLRGKDGVDIKERWKDGVFTHLGMCISGCPNLFMLYGPQAPTAFTNGPIFLEVQADFISDFLTKLKSENIKTFEAQHQAEVEWKQDIQDMNDKTLLGGTDSWYMGANIPGKKREQLNYLAGVKEYDKACRKALEGWEGFDLVSWGKAEN